MRLLGTVFATLSLVTSLGCGSGLPPAQSDALDRATTFEVMRIDPEAGPGASGPEDFGGHRVLGRAMVRDAESSDGGHVETRVIGDVAADLDSEFAKAGLSH